MAKRFRNSSRSKSALTHKTVSKVKKESKKLLKSSISKAESCLLNGAPKTSQSAKKHLSAIYRFHLTCGLGFLTLGIILWGFAQIGVAQASLSDTLPSFHLSKRTKSGDAWSYFHPFWNTGFGLKITRKKDLLSFQHILADPDNLLGENFQVGTKFRDRVLFWIHVYSKYDSRVKVVHDRYRMDVVYGYLDFRPLFRQIKHPIRRDIKIRKLEKQALKILRAHIREATGIAKTSDLNANERARISSFLSDFRISTPDDVANALNNLRTQTGQRDMFLKAIQRSKNLLPHIESVFRKYKLPLVLARIPFVESSFHAGARSKIGAMGIWQFMQATAREMISPVDNGKWDDPIAQTKAAARLLRNYRGALPDWPSTITAYNSGIGNVRKALRKYRAKKFSELLDNPEDNGLGFAGENFYSEVVAAALVEAYKEEVFSFWLGKKELARIMSGKPFDTEACDTHKK